MNSSVASPAPSAITDIARLLARITPDGCNRFRIRGMATVSSGIVETSDLARALEAAQAFPVAEGCMRVLSGDGMRFTLDGQPETRFMPLGETAEWLGVTVSVIEFAFSTRHVILDRLRHPEQP